MQGIGGRLFILGCPVQGSRRKSQCTALKGVGASETIVSEPLEAEGEARVSA